MKLISADLHNSWNLARDARPYAAPNPPSGYAYDYMRTNKQLSNEKKIKSYFRRNRNRIKIIIVNSIILSRFRIIHSSSVDCFFRAPTYNCVSPTFVINLMRHESGCFYFSSSSIHLYARDCKLHLSTVKSYTRLIFYVYLLCACRD